MDTLPKGNPEITQDNPPDFSIDNDTQEWLLKLWDRCESLHESEWLNIKRQMIRARNYFDGRQYGDVNNQLQWMDYPKRPGEVSYTAPVYQAHIQTALMEMSKGKTDLSFSHVSGDSRKGSLVAKMAEARYKAHRRQLFNVIKEQQENLSLLLNGVAIRYTYVTDCGGEKNPSFGEKETGEASTQACAECMSPSEGECPNCGSTEVMEVKAPNFSMKAVMGYSEIPQKESDWVNVDPLGCVWYLHASTVKETPYFIWKQAVLKEVIEAKYPDVRVTEGITSPELQYKAFNESSTPGIQLLGSDQEQGKCEIAQGWFDIDLYKNYIPKKDLKLRDGVVAPAGKKLGEAFPDGLLLFRNGKKILDIRNESKNNKVTIAPYVTRPGTMIGAGTSAALDDQDTKNDLRNLHMQSIFNDAFRKEFVDAAYIDPDQIPSDPTQRAVLHNSPPNNKIVGGAIDVLPPSPLSPDAYAMEEKLDGELQMLLGTFAGVQAGMPDLKAVQNTASGMQMWREMTVGRFYPMLAARADCLDKEQCYQLLENDQKYLSPKQWDKYKGDYGDEALKMFLNCDLRKELIIEVVPESFMPVSTSQRQAGLMGWAEFIVNTQAPPDSEMAAYAANLYGIPKSLVGNDAYVSMANVSIDAFKEQADAVIDEFGDIPTWDIQDETAMMMAQLILDQAHMPVSAKMDNHSVLADAYKDWWASDEGRNASNLLKATVLLRMEEIDGAVIAKTQDDMMKAMAAQQPMIDAQNQQMQAQAEAEGASAKAQAEAEAQANEQQMQMEREKADMEAQKRDADLEAKAIEKTIDIEQRDKEMAHEASEAEKARQHDLEMAKIQSKNKKTDK